jgi:hypothetical protein
MPVDVSELLALSDDLKKSGAKVRRQVIKVVGQTTDDVERDMKAAVPVRTGALRDSITASGRGLTGTVQTSLRYAVFVAYGSAHNPSPVDFINPPADSAQTTFPPAVEDAVIRALDL